MLVAVTAAASCECVSGEWAELAAQVHRRELDVLALSQPVGRFPPKVTLAAPVWNVAKLLQLRGISCLVT